MEHWIFGLMGPPNILVSFHLGWFSTYMIKGERVTGWDFHSDVWCVGWKLWFCSKVYPPLFSQFLFCFFFENVEAIKLGGWTYQVVVVPNTFHGTCNAVGSRFSCWKTWKTHQPSCTYHYTIVKVDGLCEIPTTKSVVKMEPRWDAPTLVVEEIHSCLQCCRFLLWKRYISWLL